MTTDEHDTSEARAPAPRGVLAPGRFRRWRTMGWMVLLFVLVALCQGLGMVLTGSLLGAGGVSLLALALYAGAVRWGEQRWPEELSPRPAARELLLGLLVGAGMFGLVMAVLLGGGVYQLEGPHRASAGVALARTLLASVLEELMFRAVLFRLLLRAFGVGWALGLSAALFGLLHLGNPNASLMAALAIAVEAGPLLASFYLLTGRLWMSIGVHAAWNFTQAFLFGAAVSGVASHSSLFVGGPRAGASELLSGGAFGPEASLPAMGVGAGIAAAVLHAARRRGLLRPP